MLYNRTLNYGTIHKTNDFPLNSGYSYSITPSG